MIRQIQKRSEYIEHIKDSYEKRVKKRTIKLYKTLEVDIKPDGTLAIPEESIDFLDYLVVSIHSSFKLSIEQQTKRILKALAYPKVKIFGHPTARLIGKREPVQADWDKVMEYAKTKNIALEINTSGDRLDLPAKLVRLGVQKNLLFSIDTDAHAHYHLRNIQGGVDVARRGWATKANVVNTWPLAKMEKWLLNK